MSQADSERLFALRGGEPLLWLEYAQGFWRSAEHLIDRMNEVRHGPLGSRRIEQIGLFNSIMLLLGLSFENLIKGIFVALHPTLVTTEKLDRSLWKSDGGHGLRDFATSVTTLNSDELSLLDRLQEHVVWAGRYPIPTSATRYHDSLHPIHKQKFSMHDITVAKQLFERLEHELRKARDSRSPKTT